MSRFDLVFSRGLLDALKESFAQEKIKQAIENPGELSRVFDKYFPDRETCDALYARMILVAGTDALEVEPEDELRQKQLTIDISNSLRLVVADIADALFTPNRDDLSNEVKAAIGPEYSKLQRKTNVTQLMIYLIQGALSSYAQAINTGHNTDQGIKTNDQGYANHATAEQLETVERFSFNLACKIKQFTNELTLDDMLLTLRSPELETLILLDQELVNAIHRLEKPDDRVHLEHLDKEWVKINYFDTDESIRIVDELMQIKLDLRAELKAIRDRNSYSRAPERAKQFIQRYKDIVYEKVLANQDFSELHPLFGSSLDFVRRLLPEDNIPADVAYARGLIPALKHESARRTIEDERSGLREGTLTRVYDEYEPRPETSKMLYDDNFLLIQRKPVDDIEQAQLFRDKAGKWRAVVASIADALFTPDRSGLRDEVKKAIRDYAGLQRKPGEKEIMTLLVKGGLNGYAQTIFKSYMKYDQEKDLESIGAYIAEINLFSQALEQDDLLLTLREPKLEKLLQVAQDMEGEMHRLGREKAAAEEKLMMLNSNLQASGTQSETSGANASPKSPFEGLRITDFFSPQTFVENKARELREYADHHIQQQQKIIRENIGKIKNRLADVRSSASNSSRAMSPDSLKQHLEHTIQVIGQTERNLSVLKDALRLDIKTMRDANDYSGADVRAEQYGKSYKHLLDDRFFQDDTDADASPFRPGT